MTKAPETYVLTDALIHGWTYQLEQDEESGWPAYDGRLLSRSEFLTASETLSCERRLAFEKRFPGLSDPEKPDTKNWQGVQTRGHVVEAWAADMIASGLPPGDRLLAYGGAQRSLYWEDVTGSLSGTPDGILYRASRPSVAPVEIKSVDPRTNLESMTAPKPKHVAQVMQNALLLDLLKEELYSGVKIRLDNFAYIIYIDASDFTRRREFRIPLDVIALNNAKLAFEKSQRVLNLWPVDLAPQGTATGECQFCNFKSACSKLGADVKLPKMPKFNRNKPQDPVTKVLVEAFAAKQNADEAAAVWEAHKESVKLHMLDQNAARLEGGGVAATLQPVKGRAVTDTKALVEWYERVTGSSAERFITTGAPSTRLTIERV